MIFFYYKCSRADRRSARVALRLLRPDESNQINRAAISYSNSWVGICGVVLAGVLAFATAEGMPRALPLITLLIIVPVYLFREIRANVMFRRRWLLRRT
jgi:hypothetical protein